MTRLISNFCPCSHYMNSTLIRNYKPLTINLLRSPVCVRPGQIPWRQVFPSYTPLQPQQSHHLATAKNICLILIFIHSLSSSSTLSHYVISSFTAFWTENIEKELYIPYFFNPIFLFIQILEFSKAVYKSHSSTIGHQSCFVSHR